MAPVKYELYAFEFNAYNLKTDKDLEDVHLEVKLFTSAPVILQNRKPYCSAEPPSAWNVGSLKQSQVSVGGKGDKSDLGPFNLDMRSLVTDVGGDGETGSEQDEDLWVEVEKGASAAGGTTTLDSTGHKQSGAPADGQPDNGPSQQQPNDQVKRSLRMFPEDPSGQPYHKVSRATAVAASGETEVVPPQGNAPSLKSAAGQPAAAAGQEANPSQTTSAAPAQQPTPRKAETATENEATGGKEPESGKEPKEDVGQRNQINADPDYKEKQKASPDAGNGFEAGMTMVLPMEAFRLVHNLQRMPLVVRVFSSDRKSSAEGRVELWPLVEAVLIAERGLPTPVTSTVRTPLTAKGDFLTAHMDCFLRLYAYGTGTIFKKSLPNNPNEEMNHKRIEDSPPLKVYNMDTSNVPPVITSPEHIAKNKVFIRRDGEKQELYPHDKSKKRMFAEDDIIFCPENRVIAPKPSDNFETMKWKIDRLLGFVNVSTEEKGEDEKPNMLEEEVKTKLKDWCKKKKKALDSQVKDVNKMRQATRALLKKILKGEDLPAPINPSSIRVAQSPTDTPPDTKENEEKNEYVAPRSSKADDEPGDEARRLYDEIKRQQREERMIKHYKRLFRKMLRNLEIKKGTPPDAVKRRAKAWKSMKTLLSALEAYPEEEVVKAYMEAMKYNGEKEDKPWDVDYWPDIVEQGEKEPDDDEDTEDAEDGDDEEVDQAPL